MNGQDNLQFGFEEQGFAVIHNVFSAEQVKEIIELIESVSTDKPAFRKSTELFAIRQLLKEIPELKTVDFYQPAYHTYT